MTVVPTAELGDLVAGLLGSVVEAQRDLDDDAQARTDHWLHGPAGDEPTPPPLWFTLRNTAVEVQLSARVVTGREGRPRMLCRTVDPVDAALHGLEIAAQVRLRVLMDSRVRTPEPTE